MISAPPKANSAPASHASISWARSGSKSSERNPSSKLRQIALPSKTATAIAKTANPLLLHLPLPGMDHLRSFAFATSPAEIERGPSCEFVLNHVLELERGTDLFRVDLSEVTNA